MSPTRRSLQVLALWLVVAVVATVWPAAQGVWAGVGAVLVAAFTLDLAGALRKPRVRVTRHLGASLPLGARTKAFLRVENDSKRARRVWLHEAHPSFFTVDGLPQTVPVPPGGTIEVPYWVRPARRGRFCFAALRYRLASPLGLWWRGARGGEAAAVRVYPNFRAVARYALLATSDRTADVGIRKQRRRGQGTEFHQLRDYRIGDSLRQIDWRATSRLMKGISREYREERDQQLVLLLDCGRRMRAHDNHDLDLSHLDQALDAVLLLAYVALRQGDAVGLSTFGGDRDRHVPIRKGGGHLAAVFNAVFDVQATNSASDTASALEGAIRALKRRTLIILVSNLRDEEDRDLLSVVKVAGRRHLVLLASLREEALGWALAELPRDFDQALTAAATHHYLHARAEAHELLGRAGLLVLDTEPGDLAASLVNRYLQLKARSAL